MNEVLALVAVFGAFALFWLYRKRVDSVALSVETLENPSPIETPLSFPQAFKRLRSIVKTQKFSGRAWMIKEDNPKGMLIAIISFEEDMGNQTAVGKRQIILTSSVKEAEGGQGCVCTLMYSVYAPFSRTSCETIVNETTSAVRESLTS